MLARVLAVVECPSVCLSVTHRFYIKTVAQIELFCVQASIDLFYTVFWEYLQKYGYFPLELFPKLRTSKILPQHERQASASAI